VYAFRPAVFAKDLPGGRSLILNISRIRRINLRPVKSDQDSAPDSTVETEDLLNWDGD
jgi:hypothetical protein